MFVLYVCDALHECYVMLCIYVCYELMYVRVYVVYVWYVCMYAMYVCMFFMYFRWVIYL